MGPSGWLSRTLPGFEFRASQLQMALLVADAVEQERPALIEAGTGTGKTLGYLVPLILSRKKAVVSTATKNLQEQIFFKDIPLLSANPLLGGDPESDYRVLMMKGRKNYLCLYRFHQNYDQASFLPKVPRARDLEEWISTTRFGDLAEIEWLDEHDPLRDSLSCSSEQCLGGLCPYLEDCFLNRLRAEAVRADLVIANHHLFFADLKVRQGGFGEVLPRSQVVVFDEAHEVEEIALTYFGETLTSRQIEDLAFDIEKEFKELLEKSEKKELQGSIGALKGAAHGLMEWFDALGEGSEGVAASGRLDQDALERLRRGPASRIWETLDRTQEVLEQLMDLSPSAPGLKGRAAELLRVSEEVTRARPDWLNWFERRKRSVAIHVTPLEIAEPLQEALFSRVKTAVFTSATISTGNAFDYIRGRLGLEEDCLEGIYPSHFDFRAQALLYIPKDLPLPADPGFSRAIAARIREILLLSSGRALVLFTSHTNLDAVYHMVRDRIPFKVFRQGEAPRSTVLKRFEVDVHSVLMATGSFWQGVDVPGEALSCLIIDKLPFDSPADPLVAARIEAIRSRGGNPFIQYQVPSAIIALRQGLGRLIRNRGDRGVMAVLDRRLFSARYGRLFLESLPPMPITHSLEDVEQFFGSLKGPFESRQAIKTGLHRQAGNQELERTSWK